MSNALGPYQRIKSEGMYKVGADIPTMEFNEIGRRGIRRYDGHEKASGKALYTRDIHVPGMLYAKVLSSPHAHARIIKMDTSKAEALPGVRGSGNRGQNPDWQHRGPKSHGPRLCRLGTKTGENDSW